MIPKKKKKKKKPYPLKSEVKKTPNSNVWWQNDINFVGC